VYGARLVQEILTDASLRQQWIGECKEMADRIMAMRTGLRDRLEKLGSARDWRHITDQIGMFCFTGLTLEEVLKIRSEYSIYCTDDGRISVAGLSDSNLDYVAEAIHTITK
jgi:aspartate aminotransferase